MKAFIATIIVVAYLCTIIRAVNKTRKEDAEELKKEKEKEELEQKRLAREKEIAENFDKMYELFLESCEVFDFRLCNITPSNIQQRLETLEDEKIRIIIRPSYTNKKSRKLEAIAFCNNEKYDEKQLKIGEVPEEITNELFDKGHIENDEESAIYVFAHKIDGGTRQKPTYGCRIILAIEKDDTVPDIENVYLELIAKHLIKEK